MTKGVFTTERAFEDTIVASLLNNGGYELGSNARWNQELAFDRATLLEFIRSICYRAENPFACGLVRPGGTRR
jgi:hypothetical protein